MPSRSSYNEELRGSTREMCSHKEMAKLSLPLPKKANNANATKDFNVFTISMPIMNTPYIITSLILPSQGDESPTQPRRTIKRKLDELVTIGRPHFSFYDDEILGIVENFNVLKILVDIGVYVIIM